MKRMALKAGEYYAIKPSAIERDADGFFIIVGDSPPENESHGSVAVVHVRGALSQFKGDGGDSYEAIVERVGKALEADTKPSALVLCISSPGGLVAGLNECVFKLQRMRTESGVPFIAQINELAASAAFALACACDRRFAPPSAIVGSIGTISTMVSQAARDKAEGLDFRIITSGKRKADGHPHFPIEDAAVHAERMRNGQLAEQFFELAGKALRQSPRRLKALEAAIFVGESARAAGLINAVRSLDETIAGLGVNAQPPPSPAPNEGNVTDRRARELAQPGIDSGAKTALLSQSGTPEMAHMPSKLKSLIVRTEAAIATETDPAQLRILEAKLGTFQARAELDGDDDDDDKKKGDDDGDDDSKSAKHAARAEKLKAKAKATDLRSKASQKKSEAAELEEEAKKCEEEAKGGEESDEEEAHLRTPTNMASLSVGAQALIEQATGMKGAAAMGAAQALFSLAKQTSARVASLEKKAADDRRASLLAQAKPLCFGKNEAKWLEAQSLETIEGFVGMRKAGGPVIHTDEGTLLRPKAEAPGTFEALPDDIRAMIEDAVSAAPSADRDSLRKALVENHNKSLAQTANGIGRY